MSEAAQSSWPGIREPTDEDVPKAGRLADRALLRSFRESLLAYADSLDCRPLFHAHAPPRTSSGQPIETSFTYPLSALCAFPDLPSDQDLLVASRSFSHTLHGHIYLHNIPLHDGAGSPLPPYLRLAYACNGAALSHGVSPDPSTLFDAAYQLCTFMVETDNRRSRSLDTILAVRAAELVVQLGRC